jgi:hypothetical protein
MPIAASSYGCQGRLAVRNLYLLTLRRVYAHPYQDEMAVAAHTFWCPPENGSINLIFGAPWARKVAPAPYP